MDGWHNVGSGHVGCGGCGPEGFIYEPISFVCILGASTGRGLMVPPSIHPPDTNHLSFHPDSNLPLPPFSNLHLSRLGLGWETWV